MGVAQPFRQPSHRYLWYHAAMIIWVCAAEQHMWISRNKVRIAMSYVHSATVSGLRREAVAVLALSGGRRRHNRLRQYYRVYWSVCFYNWINQLAVAVTMLVMGISMNTHLCISLQTGFRLLACASLPRPTTSLSAHRGRFRSGFRTCLYCLGTRGRAFEDQGQPNKFKEGRGGGNRGHCTVRQQFPHSEAAFTINSNLSADGNLKLITVSFVF